MSIHVSEIAAHRQHDVVCAIELGLRLNVIDKVCHLCYRQRNFIYKKSSFSGRQIIFKLIS